MRWLQEPLLQSWTGTAGKVGKQMGTGDKESLIGQLFGQRVVVYIFEADTCQHGLRL